MQQITGSENMAGNDSLPMTKEYAAVSELSLPQDNIWSPRGVNQPDANKRAPYSAFTGHILFNALTLHRNGPYGYPSWKQIRTGEHAVARFHKKNNILSVSDKPKTIINYEGDQKKLATELKASTFTNYVEPPVSIRAGSIIHNLTSFGAGSSQELTIQYSFGNNIVKFANYKIDEESGEREYPPQMYDDLKDMYLGGDLALASNPIKAFRSLIYLVRDDLSQI